MNYLILILIFFNFIVAETKIKKIDDNKTLNDLYQLINKKDINTVRIESLLNELNRIQLNNRVFSVNNLALDIDTDNKILNEKVQLLKTHIEFILNEQEKRYESLSNNQRHIYETKIELIWWNISLVTLVITILLSLISFYGYKVLKKKINKTVTNEIIKNHKEETKKLIESLSEEKDFIELIKAEIDNSKMDEIKDSEEIESFDGGVKYEK